MNADHADYDDNHNDVITDHIDDELMMMTIVMTSTYAEDAEDTYSNDNTINDSVEENDADDNNHHVNDHE